MPADFSGLPFGPADILMPQKVDLTRWAVVACDQYTSQPDYWARVEALVGQAPSSLRLILPESRLGGPDVAGHIRSVNAAMEDYLARGLFARYPDSLIYVERALRSGKVRRGLVGRLDLAAYDFTPGSGAPVRATEGTVLSRVPPRAAVRQGAPLELPHILLLADDRERTIMPALSAAKEGMRRVYDFDLMEDSGRLTGWLLGEEEREGVAAALGALSAPEAFQRRYDAPERPPLVLAVGDGNHSLAAAKACWEANPTPLNRYALCELVDLWDESLEFEPIHRVVFGVEPQALLAALRDYYPESHGGEGEGHVLRWVTREGEGTLTVPNPQGQLEVGTLQAFLDDYLAENAGDCDYIHGEDVTRKLALQDDHTMAFLLPPMAKDRLFPTVIWDGVLPRKTFSMGEAHDKRFYLEARKIR